jgi:hypothetical protein
MAHYAFIDENNIVVDVITGRDEDDLAEGVTSWEEYYGENRGLRCLRTSYNTVAGVHAFGGTALRGNYAGLGFSYDEALDAFIPPKAYNSWVLDEKTYSWTCPVPYPTDGLTYKWNDLEADWEFFDFSESDI